MKNLSYSGFFFLREMDDHRVILEHCYTGLLLVYDLLTDTAEPMTVPIL